MTPISRSKIRPPAISISCPEMHKGKGSWLWDIQGNKYLDFHSAYATLNQGHSHPYIVDALVRQSKNLSLTSCALKHDQSQLFAEKITATFGYECVIPMNTGTEACETAIKYCRFWGYKRKNVQENEAIIIMASGNYWGHSISALSGSSSQNLRMGFGPYLPGFQLVPYNDLSALEEALSNPNVVGFMVEPVQAEEGIIIPEAGYLRLAKNLCSKNNVLFIADEVQTGMGRSGALVASSLENIKPDILILGKALSGGLLPVSAVLCDRAVGDTLRAGTHYSTFAGNPLACSVAVAAIEVIENEGLIKNAQAMGELFREEVKSWKIPWITEVRGKGLLNGVEIDATLAKASLFVWKVSRDLLSEQLISVPISDRVLRFCPPLIITPNEMHQALEKIKNVFLKKA